MHIPIVRILVAGDHRSDSRELHELHHYGLVVSELKG